MLNLTPHTINIIGADGAGFCGIRVEKKLRPTREIVLAELTAADKGRRVVVEVYRFDAKIVTGGAHVAPPKAASTKPNFPSNSAKPNLEGAPSCNSLPVCPASKL